MKLYNTLTRNKEDFAPLDGKTVRMYACGPTVYSYAHIGNMRTYIFMDIIRRALKYSGYKLKGVMNITDVGHLMSDADEGEDKMAKAAKEQQKTPQEIADHYTQVFMQDIAKLNIAKPEIIAKATDHIKEMQNCVVELVKSGYAYEISDGIYFDISKFEGYGKLSRLNLDDQIAGARVEINSEKRHPADFALWKKAEPNHIMQWDSPWGKGYPGWHIECSAMSRKYLGDCFDIHSGGVDHIPVHHENEIAQNEALSGKKSVNFWLHGEFMLVDNGKMSKSLGNVYTISDLEQKGYSALDFRYFCLNAHYRKKLNFTFEGMDAARTSLDRLRAVLYQHKTSNNPIDKEVVDKYRKQFIEAVEDDLNIPLALGILWSMTKEEKSADIYALALDMDKVLGLSLDKVQAKATEQVTVPDEIIELAKARLLAKQNKDYAKADEIRGEITAKGYTIADTKEGYTIRKADK